MIEDTHKRTLNQELGGYHLVHLDQPDADQMWLILDWRNKEVTNPWKTPSAAWLKSRAPNYDRNLMLTIHLIQKRFPTAHWQVGQWDDPDGKFEGLIDMPEYEQIERRYANHPAEALALALQAALWFREAIEGKTP